jgi:hypothetical protein
MICLGSPQTSPSRLEAEAAQLFAVAAFRNDFLRRWPGGMVISELEYMGRTTAAPNQPGPLLIPGNRALSRIMDALSQDFRRWVKDRDYRKCDALGLSVDGSHAELLEVTTGDNMLSATTQIAAKLAILRETVNRIHDMSVDWVPALWLPGPLDLFYELPSAMDEVRYLCYMPTYRLGPTPGVILYEVHVIKRPTVPVPVQVPDEVKEKLRQGYQERKIYQDDESWARDFLGAHPIIRALLQTLAAVLGVALLIAALVLIFDPAPGDEVAAASAGMALLKFATGG